MGRATGTGSGGARSGGARSRGGAGARLALVLLACPLLAAAAPAPGARWSSPVGPGPLVRERFEAPAHEYAAGHRGADLAAQPGAAVRAPADGVVHFAGPVAGRPVVSILHFDGTLSSLEPVEAVVAAGEAVRRGQELGRVGAGGHCDGRCVHLGARVGGRYVDPLVLLGLGERSILLPRAPSPAGGTGPGSG